MPHINKQMASFFLTTKCNLRCTPVPHFTTDGYISACDLVTIGEKAEHMECFVYGKWNSDAKSFDIDNKKIELLQARSVNNMEHSKSADIKVGQRYRSFLKYRL